MAADTYLRLNAAKTPIATVEDNGSSPALSAADPRALTIAGETIVRECGQFGIVAFNGSTIDCQAWALQPRKHFLTTIETTSPVMKYAAMFAAANSTLHIIDRGFLNDPSIAQVKILNRNLHQSDEYFGVALDSHSTLLNAKRLSYADPTINEGKDTVPEEQQIMRLPGAECVSVE